MPLTTRRSVIEAATRSSWFQFGISRKKLIALTTTLR